MKKHNLVKSLFNPISCYYTSLPLDGAARNLLLFLFIDMDTQDHTICHIWINLLFLPPMPEKRKTIWSELESNPGPLASQGTALTSRQTMPPRATSQEPSSHSLERFGLFSTQGFDNLAFFSCDHVMLRFLLFFVFQTIYFCHSSHWGCQLISPPAPSQSYLMKTLFALPFKMT